MQDVINYVEQKLDLLELSELISGEDAARRASAFLPVIARLNNFKWEYAQKEIQTKSLRDATKANVMADLPEMKVTEEGKKKAITVGERDTLLDSNSDYQGAREQAEQAKAAGGVINNYIEMFTNAHIFYRGLAKGMDSE